MRLSLAAVIDSRPLRPCRFSPGREPVLSVRLAAVLLTCYCFQLFARRVVAYVACSFRESSFLDCRTRIFEFSMFFSVDCGLFEWPRIRILCS